MKYPRSILCGVLLIAVLPLIGQINPSTPKDQQQTPPPKAAGSAESDSGQGAGQGIGQRVFEQNCSRCHNAPDGFSPNISGTVAMHMRTRANLSQADYDALRRFFNP